MSEAREPNEYKTRGSTKTPEEFWAWLEPVFPWVAAAIVITICLIYSAKKSIWMDEVFSLLLLRDPSFTHMTMSLRNGVDAGIPPYYFFGRLWGATFGASLLSFRLFSAVAIAGAILVAWRPLVRRYSVPSVAFGLFVTVLQSQLVMGQATEARFYGMFTLAAMIFVAALLRFEDETYTTRDLLLVALANVFLLYSHLLGFLYSAAASAALLMWDIRRSRLRPKLYATLASSWLALALLVPTLIRISDTGKPHSWMPMPWLPNLFDFYTFESSTFVAAIIAALVLLVFSRLLPRDKPPGLAVYLGLSFLLIPAAAALKSHCGVVLFNPRYFLPSIFGAAILIASALDHIGVYPRAMTVRISEAWAVLIAALLIYPAAFFFGSVPPDDRYAQLGRVLEGNTPVIVEDANTFLPLVFLQTTMGPQYYYPLDWEEALKSSTLDATVHYKLMRNWKQNGYLATKIVDSRFIICGPGEFLVLDNPEMTWFEDRIKKNSEFEFRPGPTLPVSYLPGPTRTWLVTRKSNASCGLNPAVADPKNNQ